MNIPSLGLPKQIPEDRANVCVPHLVKICHVRVLGRGVYTAFHFFIVQPDDLHHLWCTYCMN